MHRRGRLVVGAAVAAAALLLTHAAVTAQTPPVFRSAVVRVAVDVQVVDRNGEPVPSLGPADFTVTIGGRQRRVVSADLIRPGYADPWLRRSNEVTVESSTPAPVPSYRRRVVIAVDSGSFEAGAWQRAFPAAREFLAGLDPDDEVGLFVAPFGPVIAPSFDRARVQRALAAVVARGRSFDSQFNLTPTEVVDIMAESAALNSPATALRRTISAALDDGRDAPTVARVQRRECPNDFDCPGRILLDASNAVADLEARTMQSLNGVDAMFAAVASWPGRKTVVFLSGGMLTSDRPGGRPDVADMARLLGRHVAGSDAVVYTLLVDATFQQAFSAGTRIMTTPGGDQMRETRMVSSWLEQFSDAAGGALFRVQADQGEAAFARVRREMGAFYLLGVEPGSEDRDGRPRALRVRVSLPGTSVRSRQWVALPPGPPSS
jgi:VWFA-related protein